MNHLPVRQRKILYATIAVLAFLPVVLVGRPSTSDAAGGRLAQLRTKHELGESSLGDVDPTSATMNLVLLGMRGVAASYLWQQADHYKDTKQFSQLRESVESIILLQPHFKSVWEYQAWNLSYNVAAECDDVKDRYHWVKQGAKFLMRGIDRNQKVPELQFGAGQFFGSKIGVADEKEVYRRYFKSDPNVEIWDGGPDEDINPEGKDNYLVARDWYLKANETLELPNVEQHRMDQALFVAYPYRSLIEFSRAHQRDGIREAMEDLSAQQLSPDQEQARREEIYLQWASESRDNWIVAFNEWTDIYGRRRIESAGGGTIILEYDDNVIEELAEADGMSFDEKKSWVDRYRKTTSYPNWKRHCEIERREEMARARYHLIEARRLYRNVQDFEGAKKFFEEGLTLLDSVVRQYEAEDGSNVMLIDETDTVEEAIKAMLIWKSTLELLGEPLPEDYPLKRLWDDPEFEYKRNELTEKFLLWQGA